MNDQPAKETNTPESKSKPTPLLAKLLVIAAIGVIALQVYQLVWGNGCLLGCARGSCGGCQDATCSSCASGTETCPGCDSAGACAANGACAADGACAVDEADPVSTRRNKLLKQFDTTGLSIPAKHLLPGGPPKDGIPALTDPRSTAASEIDYLQDEDRVVAVAVNDKHKAYPLKILNWHEIINDTVGGVPIAVIYCPLCDSASVVDRRIGESTLEFGVSGLLHNSNVVMYDRTDQALWSQVKLTALSGPHVGQSLRHLPFELIQFKTWRDEHRASPVADTRTGHTRQYNRNPYQKYFQHDRLVFPVTREDSRLATKQAVIGLRRGEQTLAVPVDAIHQASEGLTVSLGGQSVTLGANDRTVAIEALAEDVQAVHTFWFTWAAMHPDTDIYQTPQE